MSIARSRITAQGQVTIPVAVMRQFGFAPGEVVEWNTLDGHLVVEKAGQFSLEDVQVALQIPVGLRRTDEQIREGIKAKVRSKHAGR